MQRIVAHECAMVRTSNTHVPFPVWPKMTRHFLPVLLCLLFPLMAATSPARAESSRIGFLECFIDSGSGFVVGSSKDISCTLYANDDTALENYIGEINKWGIDIGFTEESYIEWAVYVPGGKTYTPGSLTGQFAGASASASLAVGLGASVLTGGQSREIALQPVTIRKQSGINIALGIARFDLRLITENQ